MKAHRLSKLILFFLFFYSSFYGQVSFFYGPSSLCKSDPNPLIQTTNYSGGGTFTASPSGLILSATTGTVNVAASAPGLYVVTLNCSTCSPAPTTTLEIKALPAPPAISPNTVCASAQQYTLAASSTDPTMTFSWAPYATTGNQVILPIMSANQNFTLIGTVKGCTSQVTGNTNTIAAIKPTITGPTKVCDGAAVSLTASTAGITSYTWNSGPTGSVFTDTPQITTVYTVETTDANGCTATDDHTVTVNPIPNLQISASPTTCVGYGNTVTAVGDATLFSWNGGGTTTNSVFANIPPSNPNTYTYTVLGSLNGCTVLATRIITLEPIPNLSIMPSSYTICPNAVFTFSAGGASHYTWMNNSAETADTYTLLPGSANALVITLAGSLGNGCESILKKTFTVTTLPVFNVFPPAPQSCRGSSVAVQALPAVYQYTWSTGENVNSVLLSPDTTTSYTVQGSRNGCYDVRTFTVVINQTPTVTVSSTTVCAGQSATLEASSTVSDGVWKWSNSASTSSIITPALNSTTNFTVTNTAPTGSCSGRAVATVSVLPSPFPNVSFKYNGPFCSASSNPLPVLSPSFATGGQFSALTSVPVNGTTGEVVLAGAEEGTHIINYIVEAKGCVKSNTSTATLLINPSINLVLPKILEILPGQSISLNHTGGAMSYEWTPATDLDCANCEFPVASPKQATSYCVSSKQACVTGDCVFVDVLCNSIGDYSVPNAFTPNRDGKNDKFCLQGWADCNKIFEVKIFDRWGQMVFESTDPNFCWDGTLGGETLQSGVYMYVIYAMFGKDAPFRKSGNISLIK